MNKKEIEKIEREIEILKIFQEKDMFVFDNRSNSAIAMVVCLFGFGLASFVTGSYFWFKAGIIGAIVCAILSRKRRLNPIKRAYCRKADLIISRYKKLGVDWNELQKEMEELDKKTKQKTIPFM
jgi:hypothetical protein